MEKSKILIVEDEVIIAKDIKRCLEKRGNIVVGIAVSGEAAIQKAELEKPDIILMDIALYGNIDGIDAANQIRVRQKIPVIFLTSYSDKGILERAKKTEPYGFLVKPFEESELYSSIEIAIYKYKMDEMFALHCNNFTSMLIHDLKNPLISIIGYTNLLTEIDDNKSERDKILYAIKTASQNMVQTIDDTSRSLVQKHKVTSFKPALTHFEDILSQIIISYLPRIKTSGLELYINKSKIEDSFNFEEIKVMADSYQLRSLVENLLGNAIKYTKSKIIIKFSTSSQNLTFSISDDGPGISEEYHEKIFDEYFQIPGSKKGSGFGLYVVRKIVNNHDGTISVISKPKEGATFTISLPVVAENSDFVNSKNSYPS